MEENIENKLKAKNVKTYTNEMVKALEGEKGGLIKKIIHEEEEHQNEQKKLSPKSKENKIFMLISTIFILLALALLFFLTFFNQKINIVSVAPQFTSMIFVDQTDFVPVDGLLKENIIETISNQINNTKVKIGGIDGVYLTEKNKIIGFDRFNFLLKTSLLPEQINLFNNIFLLGAFKNGLSSISPNIGDPFVLLKIKSFSDIFPVMHSWESKMLYDLNGIFEVKITPETNYLFTKDFEDGIIANKNARILRDDNGKIILMYVFINDTSLIITNSEGATSEVVLRINSSQIKK